MLEPEKLIGKRIGWRTLKSVSHGEVVAMTSQPDVVLCKVGNRFSKETAKVNVRDILKVY